MTKLWLAGLLSLSAFVGVVRGATEVAFPSGDFETPGQLDRRRGGRGHDGLRRRGGPPGNNGAAGGGRERHARQRLPVRGDPRRGRQRPTSCASGRGTSPARASAVYLHFHDATGRTLNDQRPNQIISSLPPESSREWAESKLFGVAPPAATSLSVWIHSYSNSKVKAEFDDFRLFELSADEAKELLDEGARRALSRGVVAYEDFGAVGDGVADDLEAICKAHEFANLHGLPVRGGTRRASTIWASGR